ncbi:hypothetical protein [Micromonospora sp. NPDC023888]|uniref:hypothetical protein n=1 Tax=Micromonospora sp. NPDC023888 TaxID=3155607 RepID=UPI0033EB54C5
MADIFGGTKEVSSLKGLLRTLPVGSVSRVLLTPARPATTRRPWPVRRVVLDHLASMIGLDP